MPDTQWNRQVWNETYRWEADGDEWSVAWGSTRSAWLGTIYPRISRFLPARRILEIAVGRGRWTQFLIHHCDEFVGVDLSQNCIETCRHRFAAENRVRFVANDGRSLKMIPNDSIDFVFSFDSLVHVDDDVMREYMWQIAQKLTPTGIAFLHHSNGGGESVDRDEARTHNRDLSVSTKLVKDLVEDCGCKPLIQEEINWAGRTLIDCWTTFCRTGLYDHVPYRLLRNTAFPLELEHVKQFHSPYNLAEL